MTINIPADRSVAPSGAADTTGTARSARSFVQGVYSGSDDRISVSSSTLNIQSTLDGLSVSRAAKVARLAQIYAGGRYAVDSTNTAKGLMGSATSVKI